MTHNADWSGFATQYTRNLRRDFLKRGRNVGTAPVEQQGVADANKDEITLNPDLN
jgi:hypothetical protein